MSAENEHEMNAEHEIPLNFTVHEFVNNSALGRQAKFVDEDSVIRDAYRIVTNGGWKGFTRGPEWGGIVSERRMKAYIFSAAAPSPHPHPHRELKEWGADVTEDEIFRMEDLEEFVGTDFGFIFSAKVSSTLSVEPGTSTKRVRTRSPSVEPEPKRRKLKVGSLVSMIPKPHILPSPYNPSQVNPANGRSYKRTLPEFIHPYTETPSSWDARLAWLVPIRGILPWDGATHAEVLENDDDDDVIPVPVPSTDPSGSGKLLWTRDSLRKFWDVLLELRKNRALGLLGVSFHVARLPNDQQQQTSSSTLPLQLPPPALGLSAVDYIKVYHDAPNALFVREMLDLWQYAYQAGDGRTRKVRMLKGSKLVLLDERSRGVQLS